MTPGSLQTQDIVWLVGVGTAAIVTLVQKLSTKYKPWSWLARQFGNAMNKDMLDKLQELEKKVDSLEKTDIKQNEERDKQLALSARRRILGFADECRRHIKHSDEYFDNILEDVSFYKRYCDEHKDFENEKAVIAMKVISAAYEHCLENDDFL